MAVFSIRNIQQNIRAISKASAQQAVNKFVLVYSTPHLYYLTESTNN
jgi:hypothetical protein